MLGVMCIIYLYKWMTGMIDYAFAAADRSPLFANVNMMLLDGGSEEFRGFGYSISTDRSRDIVDKMILEQYGVGHYCPVISS
jgi:hypothetical protein